MINKVKNIVSVLALCSLVLLSCKEEKNDADAYGNFESTDQIVSAESSGKMISFSVEEGQLLTPGQSIGLVDTTQLYLKKMQLNASIKAIKGKLQDIEPQVNLIKKQISVLKKERDRVLALLKEEAATQKQLDDIQGKLDIFDQQILTIKAQNKNANRAVLSQTEPIKAQILQVEDQIKRCEIVNPTNGTVLLKLGKEGEMVSPMKPLYKIADVSSMELRAYVSGEQLPHISLNQDVFIEIDENEDDNKRVTGKISWISDRAEFTPKTIQTKEERVNLVYAFKVKVDNKEGNLKIGMPGEVHFLKGKGEEQE